MVCKNFVNCNLKNEKCNLFTNSGPRIIIHKGITYAIGKRENVYFRVVVAKLA